ncbi:MAG TPA: isoprenylcysteine carboxylmethyltransferase family protein [Pyrinomonadaceae bacterium]|nr:isoprenylcysteine carboxylmethyltransferase family protein [Pyrinomonadaceae bacterium]
MKAFGPASCDSVAADQSADKAAHSKELLLISAAYFTLYDFLLTQMNFFDYFQLAIIALFLLIIVVKTFYLRRRKINPIVIGGGKRGLLLIIEILAFAVLIAWMVEIVLYAVHSSFRIFPAPLDSSLINSLLTKVVGVILITIGLILFLIAYVSFGDSWRVGFDVKTPGALVTKGVFSITRNPIYLFLDLWFVGAFLINGTLVFLIMAILAIGVQHWQILQEEAFLTNLYGQPYRDYCVRTRRYF